MPARKRYRLLLSAVILLAALSVLILSLPVYRFDLTVPDFDTLPAPKSNVFVEGLARIGIKIKRGN